MERRILGKYGNKMVQKKAGCGSHNLAYFCFAKFWDNDIMNYNAERDTGGLKHGKRNGKERVFTEQ